MEYPNYIKVIYTDGDVWFARKEGDIYVGDSLLYSTVNGETSIRIGVNATSKPEILFRNENASIEPITKIDYWDSVINKINKSFDKKIENLKNEILNLNSRKNELIEQCQYK